MMWESIKIHTLLVTNPPKKENEVNKFLKKSTLQLLQAPVELFNKVLNKSVEATLWHVNTVGKK